MLSLLLRFEKTSIIADFPILFKYLSHLTSLYILATLVFAFNSALSAFEDYYNTLKDDVRYTLPGEKEFNIMKEALNDGDEESNKNIMSIFRKSDSQKHINKMDKYFNRKRARQFQNDKNKKWLINGLEKEFSRIIVGEKARIGVGLKIDAEYHEAVKVLTNRELYDSIMGY